MEAAGIAPASRDPSVPASTCVSACLIVGLRTPIGKVSFGLSHHRFSQGLNRRFDPDDPALTSSGEASGRRPAAKPLGSAVRQPYGERVSSQHLNFGPLLTWPADQPRHATRHFSNPVDPGSPPIVKEHQVVLKRLMTELSAVTPSGQGESVSLVLGLLDPYRVSRPVFSGRRACRRTCDRVRRRSQPSPSRP